MPNAIKLCEIISKMASSCLLHPQVLLFNLVKQLLKKQIWKVKIYDIIKAFNAQIRQVNFCFWCRLFRMEVCWGLYHPCLFY